MSDREIAVNVVFGIFATGLGFITLWQAHRLWRTLHQHNPAADVQNDASMTPDVELGPVSSLSSTTVVNDPNHSVIDVPSGNDDQSRLGGVE
ncbi:MAG: hypothetical protein Q9166_002262 [cf. Caloplaca sp. 2 TL-2023]